MKLTEKIKEAISTTENFVNLINYCNETQGSIALGDIIYASIGFEKAGAIVYLDVNCIFTLNSIKQEAIEQFQFKVGITTPKGYFSTKKMPITVIDAESLTEIELTEIMQYFNPLTKENTFDPFYFENNERSKNAAGWAIVASKLQADCR
jgi:hypothetical protein